MSRPLALLRYRCLVGPRRPLQAKKPWGLVACGVSLALALLSVSAQAAPVRIGVQIGGPSLESSGSGSLPIASLSTSGLSSGLVFTQLVSC